ncbi:hypothetical protein MNBD_NITROSPINAE02-191 [hydrothermal vent metagenome]|uniref:Cytochrome c domain-containing protein n=1 Tax=hydrothermal vent metagenome TaxID=652676 RepID=A0A3B1BXG0_9ZZZZ
MVVIRFCLGITTLAILLVFGFGSSDNAYAANPCNPCAKNACNPCAKNACNPCAKNACNPCAKNACNPCNPCASAPSKPIRSIHVTDWNKLVAKGKALWNNEDLGKSGLACMTCHDEYERLNVDKHQGQWPHAVKMTNDIVTLDQMINFCMINPMEGSPLDSNGVEMTAMAAYYREYVKAYKPENPCAKNACNPCAKNPCGGNPCGR